MKKVTGNEIAQEVGVALITVVLTAAAAIFKDMTETGAVDIAHKVAGK